MKKKVEELPDNIKIYLEKEEKEKAKLQDEIDKYFAELSKTEYKERPTPTTDMLKRYNNN